MAVTALLVGTSVAQAVSVEWGGQLRPRFEYNEQAFFNATGAPAANQGTQNGDYFVSSRIRLHAKADILPDTSAFIQLQSVRNWGNDLDALSANQPQTNGAGPGGGGSSGGSGNAAFAPSDNDQSVGVHQAYFTLKNFATLPADLKVGRQEVVIDGHRIFGNTGWTQGAQTHDAVRVTHSEGNHTISYVYSLANEGSRGTAIGSSPNDDEDVEVHLGYANLQGILGGGLSLYFVGVDDDCSIAAVAAGTCANTATGVLDNNNYTVGVRQAGQLFGIDYRGEFYYQFGDAEGDAGAANVTTGVGTPYSGVVGASGGLKDTDRSAYMFGARIGKKFNNVMWKPSITLWYDYLSGTSDSDARKGDFKTFNTLFDTGHKFYGFMDLFLPANGANTNFLGLVDYAVKTSIQPANGWTLKADWHYFTTAESIGVNSNFSGSDATNGDGNALGNEVDVTLVHKYNANTTISAGWSKFWQEEGFELVNGSASSIATVTPADWAYLMFDVKF
ncbi:MAG: hypothetical protein NPINA01_24160 [Nitrospinaceae bacterium]|nr:MAG: hypothetical protein NPINA01_24160 [Nitrospinaceae bacterium]